MNSMVAAVGLEPASARWEGLSLPGTSLLEIGPGTGHLLVAAHKAGRSVAAVEPSEVHRAFIRDTWGIRSLYPDITAIPDGLLFDSVVAINVLEHVYGIITFLSSITKLLAPDGVLFRIHRECGIFGGDSAKRMVVDVQGARPCFLSLARGYCASLPNGQLAYGASMVVGAPVRTPDLGACSRTRLDPSSA